MKHEVFGVATPCTWERSRRFGWTYLHLQDLRRIQAKSGGKLSCLSISVSCFVHSSEDGNDVFLRNFWLSQNYTEITSQKTALCIKGDLRICGMITMIGSKWLILGSNCLRPRCKVVSSGTLKDVNFVAVWVTINPSYEPVQYEDNFLHV